MKKCVVALVGIAPTKSRKKGQNGGAKGSNLKNQVVPSGSKLGSKQATSNEETKFRSTIWLKRMQQLQLNQKLNCLLPEVQNFKLFTGVNPAKFLIRLNRKQ